MKDIWVLEVIRNKVWAEDMIICILKCTGSVKTLGWTLKKNERALGNRVIQITTDYAKHVEHYYTVSKIKNHSLY